MSYKIGDIVEGEIIDFTHEGDGVLKSDNYTIFVPGGLIGDNVKIKINKTKKNFSIGSIVDIIGPSKHREKLDFDKDKIGGGVPLLEYNYSKQLEWKKEKVKMDLNKIAGLSDVKVHNTLGMDYPFRYRNHTQIPIGIKDGEPVIGFFEKNTNNIEDMNGSILQPIVGDKIILTIREWIKRYKIQPYDKKTNKGVLRHIGLRFNKDNKIMLILVTASDKLPYKEN